MDNFPLKLQLRLDWSELDLFGHVNNVAYFKYIQASRVNYWEVSGLAGPFTQTRIGPILVSSACQFIKPLFYPGNIVIECSIEFIKTTSFGMHHRILNDKGEVCAEAHDVIVTYDFNKNEKVPIADSFRKKVAEIEDREF